MVEYDEEMFNQLRDMMEEPVKQKKTTHTGDKNESEEEEFMDSTTYHQHRVQRIGTLTLQ